MTIGLTSANFEAEVLKSEIPVIVHFSFGNEFDAEIESSLNEIYPQYSDKVKFGKIVLTPESPTAQKYGVSVAPTLLIFKDGKVVVQMLGTVWQGTLKFKLDTVLKSPSEKLPELTIEELTKASQSASKAAGPLAQWQRAITSGLVSGVIAAIAVYYTGKVGFGVWLVCYMFFINSLRTSLQKFVAIVMMLSIGYFGEDLLQLSMDTSRDLMITTKNIAFTTKMVKTLAPPNSNDLRLNSLWIEVPQPDKMYLNIEILNKSEKNVEFDRIETKFLVNNDLYEEQTESGNFTLNSGQSLPMRLSTEKSFGFYQGARRRVKISVYKGEKSLSWTSIKIPKSPEY
jgi:thioredoxin 1